MKKSYFTIAVVVILIAIIAFLFLGYLTSEDLGEKTTAEVYGDGYINMTVFVNEIKNHEYFEGYDNDTLGWLESLDDGYIVVSSNETYYIMSPLDANNIPWEFATDISVYDTIKFNIIEQKSLGSNLRMFHWLKMWNSFLKELHTMMFELINPIFTKC